MRQHADRMSPSRDADLAHLDEHGFVILRNPLGDALFTRVAEASLRAEVVNNTKPGANDFDGIRTLRTLGLLADDPVFAEVALHPCVLGLAEARLGLDCQFGSIILFTILPGETVQPMHSDHVLQPSRYPGVDTSLLDFGYVALLAVSGFSAANGGTRFVPGSHKWPAVGEHEDHGSFIRVSGRDVPVVAEEMKRGDVFVFDARLWHGGGANSTADQRRSGLAYAYWAGWLRADENNLLLLSKDRIKSLPPRLQELIGLTRFNGHWGHFAGRDPKDWLNAP